MNKNIDFTKMTNSEINIKMMSYDNEYQVKKSKIIEMIHELEDLDDVYNKAKDELKKRGILNNG